jgi:hypothetical protein
MSIASSSSDQVAKTTCTNPMTNHHVFNSRNNLTLINYCHRHRRKMMRPVLKTHTHTRTLLYQCHCITNYPCAVIFLLFFCALLPCTERVTLVWIKTLRNSVPWKFWHGGVSPVQLAICGRKNWTKCWRQQCSSKILNIRHTSEYVNCHMGTNPGCLKVGWFQLKWALLISSLLTKVPDPNLSDSKPAIFLMILLRLICEIRLCFAVSDVFRKRCLAGGFLL